MLKTSLGSGSRKVIGEYLNALFFELVGRCSFAFMNGSLKGGISCRGGSRIVLRGRGVFSKKN